MKIIKGIFIWLIRWIFSVIASVIAAVFVVAGIDFYQSLKDPCTRVRYKKKINKFKNKILRRKDEEL